MASPPKSRPTVAILGASSDRTKYGNKSVRAHLQQGYDVYPINPKGGEIEGLKVYRTLAELPESAKPLTRISVYLPPHVVLQVLGEIAEVGCEEFWLNPGSESDEVVARAESLGLDPIRACSIVNVGVNPSEL
jgi:predicted CoA-binding protein